MAKDLLKVLESMAVIANVFKPRKSIVEQKARKRKLKNDLRKIKIEKKILRIQNKINKRKSKLKT